MSVLAWAVLVVVGLAVWLVVVHMMGRWLGDAGREYPEPQTFVWDVARGRWVLKEPE